MLVLHVPQLLNLTLDRKDLKFVLEILLEMLISISKLVQSLTSPPMINMLLLAMTRTCKSFEAYAGTY
jgi:hypothetical protein